MRPAPTARPTSRAARIRRPLRVAAVLVGLASAAAASASPEPEACPLLWQVTARLDAQPRQLQVNLHFDAGSRTRTTLRLPDGWDGMLELADADQDAPAVAPRLQPVAGAPALRSVTHPAGQRVHLAWRLTPATETGGTAQLAAGWFAFSGPGVLPLPEELDEGTASPACIQLRGLPAGSRWASSHGLAEGGEVLYRLGPSPTPLAVRVQQGLFAGGALQSATPPGDAAPLTAVVPVDAGWRFGVEALAQAGADALAAQRRQWAEHEPAPPWLMLMLPLPQAPRGLDISSGTAWYQAVALQAGTDLPLPGARFDALIAQALARAWVADRFGPMAYAGRGDEPLRAWFSEGWSDYLAHRSLLRDGHWTPLDYAAALNRKITAYLDAPERDLPNAQLAAGVASRPALAGLAGARGEWLALRWHAALRAAGQPGLDAVMRRLLVPPALARREGPISEPLAIHRLMAALRPVLDDQPLRDVKRFIEQGDLLPFGPGALGPCFHGERVRVPSWRLGFDAASLVSRVVAGVQPGGPAEAAGLHDGMRLIGHSLLTNDPTQPVRVVVQADDGSRREISWLPGGEPVRELPRYQPVPDALQQPACLGWLGLGPLAASAVPTSARKPAADPGQKTVGKARRKAGTANGKSAAKSAVKSARKSAPQTPPVRTAPRKR